MECKSSHTRTHYQSEHARRSYVHRASAFTHSCPMPSPAADACASWHCAATRSAYRTARAPLTRVPTAFAPPEASPLPTRSSLSITTSQAFALPLAPIMCRQLPAALAHAPTLHAPPEASSLQVLPVLISANRLFMPVRASKTTTDHIIQA